MNRTVRRCWRDLHPSRTMRGAIPSGRALVLRTEMLGGSLAARIASARRVSALPGFDPYRARARVTGTACWNHPARARRGSDLVTLSHRLRSRPTDLVPSDCAAKPATPLRHRTSDRSASSIADPTFARCLCASRSPACLAARSARTPACTSRIPGTSAPASRSPASPTQLPASRRGRRVVPDQFARKHHALHTAAVDEFRASWAPPTAAAAPFERDVAFHIGSQCHRRSPIHGSATVCSMATSTLA